MAYSAVQNEISRMIVVLGGIVLVFTGAVIYMGVAQSLKVAGPLFALKRSLEALGRRQWDRANVRFRNRDDFQDLESTYNRVVEELRSKQ